MSGGSELRQPSRDRILFVYNVDGGAVERTLEHLHKLVRSATYPCSLCALTYSALDMRGPWRKFVDRQPYEIQFLHRDEFISECQELADLKLPAVLSTPPTRYRAWW